MLPVSVLIHTLNEEVNLPFCLESILGKFNQIIVVDSCSNDNTRKIAESYGVDIYSRSCDRSTLVEQRNWALENVNFINEWVFILDADETIPNELYVEIGNAITNKDIDGYWVRYKNIFLGKWVKYGAIYPNWNMRLFKHNILRYEKRTVNAHINIENKRAGWLKEHFIHEDRRGIRQFIQRLGDIAIVEGETVHEINRGNKKGLLKSSFLSMSEVERRRAFKCLFIKVPLKPVLMFLYLYFFKLGMFGGAVGFYYCAYRSFIYLVMDMIIYEKQSICNDYTTASLKNGTKS